MTITVVHIHNKVTVLLLQHVNFYSSCVLASCHRRLLFFLPAVAEIIYNPIKATELMPAHHRLL